MEPPEVSTKSLVGALTDAFPAKKSLEKMVVFELEGHINVTAVNWSDDIETVAFELVKLARSTGNLKHLIRAACAVNPGNPRLQPICMQLADWLAPPGESEAKNDIQAALDAAEARANQASSPSARPDGSHPFDMTKMISFDLECQVPFFMSKLAQKTGAVAFSLSGSDVEFLRGYVIKRIEKVISDDGREYKRMDPEISVIEPGSTPNGRNLIDEAVAAEFGNQQIGDLLDHPKVDVLLVIWNRHIELEVLGPMAIESWDAITAQVNRAVAGKQRRLIAVWVNVGREPLRCFDVVPEIPPFNVDRFSEHVKNQLTDRMAEPRIQWYFEEAVRRRGNLTLSFSLITKIREELSARTTL